MKVPAGGRQLAEAKANQRDWFSRTFCARAVAECSQISRSAAGNARAQSQGGPIGLGTWARLLVFADLHPWSNGVEVIADQLRDEVVSSGGQVADELCEASLIEPVRTASAAPSSAAHASTSPPTARLGRPVDPPAGHHPVLRQLLLHQPFAVVEGGRADLDRPGRSLGFLSASGAPLLQMRCQMNTHVWIIR